MDKTRVGVIAVIGRISTILRAVIGYGMEMLSAASHGYQPVDVRPVFSDLFHLH